MGEIELTNFDVVVLDFTTLGAFSPQHEYAAARADAEFLAQLGRHVFRPAVGSGELVLIGDPGSNLVDVLGTTMPASDCVPSSPERLTYNGDNGSSPGSWSFWFELIDRYPFHFTGSTLVPGSADTMVSSAAIQRYGHIATLEMNAEGTDRAGHWLGWSASYRVFSDEHDFLRDSIPVYWLPSVTGLSPIDAMRKLLGHRYGIEVGPSAPPEWSIDYALPSERPMRMELSAVLSRRDELSRRIDDINRAIVAERRYVSLLYEKGKDTLEPLVREALAQLGATVREGEGGGELDDGSLVAPNGVECVLEVHGTKNDAPVQKLRQLKDWMDSRVEADPGWSGVGLFVINHHCEDDPHDRKDPFTDHALRLARRWDQTLLTTSQLYAALAMQQRGELPADWWDEVTTGDGPAAVADLDAVSER